MKRMKSLKASALKVLFGMAVLCTIMFSACPNAAKGGGKSGPAYVKVAYAELETYLANTASADKVNYIEITGTIQPAAFKGKNDGSNAEAGDLGKKILAAAPKKVALKLPGKVEGLDSMSWCFYGCTNLVSLANIPESVKNMVGCFSGCTSLTQATDIPLNVTNMYYCFYGCSALKGVKLLCNYDGSEYRFRDVSKNCTALENGGIKVKNEHYDAYTAPAALDDMAVPPASNTAEQKKKFSKF